MRMSTVISSAFFLKAISLRCFLCLFSINENLLDILDDFYWAEEITFEEIDIFLQKYNREKYKFSQIKIQNPQKCSCFIIHIWIRFIILIWKYYRFEFLGGGRGVWLYPQFEGRNFRIRFTNLIYSFGGWAFDVRSTRLAGFGFSMYGVRG